MKRRYLAAIFVLILLIIFMVITSRKVETPYKNYDVINYQLEDKNLRLLVADTPEKRQRGLMNIRTLKEADGMIFIFEQPQIQAFWNKNTFIDLDLYWINNDKVVGKTKLSSIEKTKMIVEVRSPKQANKVIELPTN